MQNTHTVIEHINCKLNLFAIIISLMELYDGGKYFSPKPKFTRKRCFSDSTEFPMGAGLRSEERWLVEHAGAVPGHTHRI